MSKRSKTYLSLLFTLWFSTCMIFYSVSVRSEDIEDIIRVEELLLSEEVAHDLQRFWFDTSLAIIQKNQCKSIIVLGGIEIPREKMIQTVNSFGASLKPEELIDYTAIIKRNCSKNK